MHTTIPNVPAGAVAVIFISKLRRPANGYAETARRMAQLAAAMPGFIGMNSWRDDDGTGVTISWWEDEASVRRWREHPEHRAAMKRGREEWYDEFSVQVCTVNRHHRGP